MYAIITGRVKSVQRGEKYVNITIEERKRGKEKDFWSSVRVSFNNSYVPKVVEQLGEGDIVQASGELVARTREYEGKTYINLDLFDAKLVQVPWLSCCDDASRVPEGEPTPF